MVDKGSEAYKAYQEYQKNVPRTIVTRPFWEGCKRHELLVQKCKECGNLRWIPEDFCLDCLSTEYDWVKVSGEGKVYTFTIVHRPPIPELKPLTPYVVAWVELKEGTGGNVRMMTNIINCDPKDVKIGMPVRVFFEDVTDEITLPKFEPAP